MNSELIMNSDVLDIVFEKRNKLYGAYALRKFYNSRLIKSISITLGAVGILSAFTFIPDIEHVLIPFTEVTMGTVVKPKKPDAKKEIPKQPLKSAQSSQKKLLNPVISDDKIKPDSMPEIKPAELIGSANIIVAGADSKGIIGEPSFVSDGGGEAVALPAAALTAIDITAPIDNPEKEPVYPGGINALKKFLERNLVNPTAMEQGEMVAVQVKFVVGYDGKLQKFTIVKDGGDIFNNEVIRVLKKMPQWVPGKSKVQNVAVYFTIPIKFVPAD